MLIIRLQRTGRRNRPEFRLILTEKRSAARSSANEIFGSYNPRSKKLSIPESKVEMLKHWLNLHTEVSPSAHNLLVTAGLIAGSKVKSFNLPKKEIKEETKPEEVAAPAEATATTEKVAVTEEVQAPAEEAAVPEEPAV